MATTKAPTASAKPTSMQTPSVGRIVHFVLDAEPFKKTVWGQVRPAIIVKIDKLPDETWHIHLQVFIDGLNDAERDAFGNNAPSTIWVPKAQYDEGQAAGTWHWPPRV